MTISGSSVHKQIKGKITDVENEVGELESKVYNCENKITGLTEEREQIYTRLATTYLPELEADEVKSIRQTLPEIRAKVEKVFKDKQQKREELENLMSSYKAERKKFEKKLDAVTDSLNQKAEERERLRGNVSKELSSDSAYTKLDENAKQAEERLKENKKRVKEIEAMAEEKLPAYGKNKIFKYLVKRGFETESYGKSGLTARLDSWVAGVINFASQKANYDFLKAMPELMAQEVSRRQKELDKVVEEMEKVEKSVSDKYGLTKVIGEGEALASERNGITQEISEKDSGYQKYVQERKELDSTKDPYHIGLVQELKALLKGETIQKLKERAKKTPGTEDDKLSGRIEEIDYTIRDLKDKAKEIKSDRDKAEKKLEGLREVESTYTRKDYKSDRSYFDKSFDINSLLIGYLAGNHTHQHVLDEMKTNHHFKPAETYHSSVNYSSTHHSSPSIHIGGGGLNFGGGGTHSVGGGGFGGFGGGGTHSVGGRF